MLRLVCGWASSAVGKWLLWVPRLIPVSLPPDLDPETIDAQADALTADMDDAVRRRAMRYAAHMNNVYGAPDRIRTLAEDLVAHWELRSELMRPQLGGPGKAVIVCVRREVCVKVYDALVERKALAEYTPSDRQDHTLGRDVDRAITEVRNEHSTICGLLAGIDWRALLADTSHPQSRRRALRLVANHLRDPRTPGNQVEPGTATLAARFRESATRLERFHRVCAMSREIAERLDDLATWRRDIAFFVEVRAWMVKLDAADREASGKPVAAEVNLYLSQLAASVVEAEEITDLYAEAGLGHLDLTQLNGEALRKLQTSETPHLAVEALRRLIEQKMREVTRHNIVRRDSFAERLENLMIRYMRQQFSSAEMIAELVAMAKEVSADARRGERFDPPLNHAELAFYDAVAHQGMARALMGDDMLAKIARALVADIRKNLSIDWLSREPVRAKLRTRIRRLLAKFDYPPDEERAAVDLVIKQMETFANEWAPEAPR